MKESVKATVPRQVYQDMRLSKIACADLTATPRNIKQVENARYLTNKTSDRSYGNLSSFADHVVYLENMAKSEDFFVRRVITGPGRVPSVICYTNEQLADIRRFCCAGPAAQNTVLGIDKTYNLGQVHVTPTVFKHLAVLKRTTNDHPIMAGPILLHGSSDHHTFAEFFYHLRSHLGINLPSPIVGSDDEKAIKSSISQVWPATKKLTCVRHIKNNLKDYLTKKVGVNEKVKSALVSTVFGKRAWPLQITLSCLRLEKVRPYKRQALFLPYIKTTSMYIFCQSCMKIFKPVKLLVSVLCWNGRTTMPNH